MSLDLSLKSTKPVRHRSTGVFIRKDGATRELETIEEVKEHFPDADLSDIHVTEYVDDTLLSINLTHNLLEMAKHVPINGTSGTLTLPRDYEKEDPNFKPKPLTAYNLLWHPETNPLLNNEVLHHKDDEGYEYDIEITRLSHEFFRQLFEVYQYIGMHREELEKFNPENGWGNYDQLLNATHKLFKAVLEITHEDALQEYYIYCDT